MASSFISLSLSYSIISFTLFQNRIYFGAQISYTIAMDVRSLERVLVPLPQLDSGLLSNMIAVLNHSILPEFYRTKDGFYFFI